MDQAKQAKTSCISCATLILATVTALQGMVKGIKITEMVVPDRVVAGGNGILECRWEEEGDKFYSVKWYQAAREFYRYTPDVPSKIQIFDTPTLDVDVGASLRGRVVIANVSLDASGPFHCEVSADSPTFHTASHHANLSVIDLPDGRPVISGVKSLYLPGDWVDITCTSYSSRPQPELSFTINNEPAQESWLDPQSDEMDYEGLIESSLRMRLQLLSRILNRKGHAKVKCSSVIPDVYHEESFDFLTTISPVHASVLNGANRTEGRHHLCRSVLSVTLTLLACLNRGHAGL